ncbi:MAG: hypothetical protein EPO22_00895 [Dehalococcoidia bacterium]|nr:MAG: hypothetical protein EPO22_00895 [Dehalococcoidia bacterium]
MRVANSPILWHNEDLPDLMPPVDAATIADEIAAAGYEGVEHSSKFPQDGAGVRELLAPRGLQLISAFAGLRIPGDDDRGEIERAKELASFVRDAGGDMLVSALDYAEAREAIAGSVGPGDPRLDECGWSAIVDALHEIGHHCASIGVTQVFHNHAATFIETPDEFGELVRRTDPSLVSLCLDVGHLVVGGGDPVACFREHAGRIRLVHLKDASSAVVASMRRREFGFIEGLRRRVFCELGTGELDVAGVVAEMARATYDGWVVLEQDTTFRAPIESARHNREAFRRLAGV